MTDFESTGVSERWRDWASDLLGIVAMLVLMAYFFGCGGGTSGTGINGANGPVIEGLVAGETGKPIEGIVVTVPETGAQTVTNTQGEFSVPVEDTVTDVTVQLEGQGIDSEVPLNNISSETTGIQVSVTVDEDTGDLVAVSVDTSSDEDEVSESDKLGGANTPEDSPTPEPLPKG